MVSQREHSRNLLYSVTTKKLPVCHQSQLVSLGDAVFLQSFCALNMRYLSLVIMRQLHFFAASVT